MDAKYKLFKKGAVVVDLVSAVIAQGNIRMLTWRRDAEGIRSGVLVPGGQRSYRCQGSRGRDRLDTSTAAARRLLRAGQLPLAGRAQSGQDLRG